MCVRLGLGRQRWKCAGGKGVEGKGGREGRGVNRGRGSAMTLSHKLRAVIHGEYSMLVAFKMLNT